MDNQVLTSARALSLKNVNRPLFWVRLFVLGLLMIFGVAGLQPRSSAQAASEAGRGRTIILTSPKEAFWRSCPECYSAYQACVGNGGSDCQAQLAACLQNCF